MGRRTWWSGCAVVVGFALTSCAHGDNRPEIAYVVEQDDAPTRVVAVKEDGKEVWTVPQPGWFRAVPPSWSPDGKRLAFVRYRSGDDERPSEVVVVGADGSGQQTVGEGAHPSWTRDGRSLVVERAGTTEGRSTIHVLSLAGGSERRLTTGSQPAVSHGGSTIAFLRNAIRPRGDATCCAFSSSLHTIASDGTGLRLVAKTAGRDVSFARPVWLPDDSGIAVLALKGTVGGSVLLYSLNGQRRVVARRVSAGADALSRGEKYEWAPTGRLLAYTRQNVLHIVRADGTAVDAFADADATDIEWSPDGRKVAFSKLEALETGQYISLYVVDLNTKERRRFAITDADAAYLDWRPRR